VLVSEIPRVSQLMKRREGCFRRSPSALRQSPFSAYVRVVSTVCTPLSHLLTWSTGSGSKRASACRGDISDPFSKGGEGVAISGSERGVAEMIGEWPLHNSISMLQYAT